MSRCRGVSIKVDGEYIKNIQYKYACANNIPVLHLFIFLERIVMWLTVFHYAFFFFAIKLFLCGLSIANKLLETRFTLKHAVFDANEAGRDSFF